MFTAWSTMPATELEEGNDAVMGSVRLVLTGAAPLTSEVAVAFEQRFGHPLRQGYGLTEASPIVTSSALVRSPSTKNACSLVDWRSHALVLLL